MNLNELTILEARAKLDKGEITALDLTKACLAQIGAMNTKLNAVLTVAESEALAQAREADERLKNGERGELLGIPYLVKDNILTKGIRTTAGSKMLENYVAPYDATVVARLQEAGAIMLGKTNLDEFAHGASTEYSYFGATKNPHDTERVPGGSSGGSAVAVASNMCLFALGTDTGGSVRHPASFCGVVGLKPSYGLCSRFGLIAMTSSTDVPGVLAKTAGDALAVLKVMQGKDEKDSTTVDLKVDIKNLKLFTKFKNLKIKNSLQGLRVGFAKEYFVDLPDKEVEEKVLAAIAKMKDLGAEIVDIRLPHTKYGVSAYYIITPCEISSNLARFDGLRYGFKETDEDLIKYYNATRGAGFGAEVKRRIMLGTYALSSGYYDAYYLKAQAVRTKIIEDFNEAFTQVDIIVTPTTPTTAFKLGEQQNDPLKMYLEDIFLTPASLAGLPAVNLPAGMIKNLPIGYQLIGPRFSDENLLEIGSIYEKS
jgi:aspartyl-tRNA(Asn)/glutamyl-tRNA(Gln) amidotransferase subunit A